MREEAVQDYIWIVTERLEGNTCLKGVACFMVEGLKTIFFLPQISFNFIILCFMGKCDLKRMSPSMCW